ELQEALLLAGVRASQRREGLDQADVALAKLRFYLRLSLDMQWLSLGQYEHASRLTDEIGRLLGGWQRKER
ncbi:MAG: four helix bundle protein, partial [Anaerolineae bacterium]|nr:four helix bundle protein [Anaerolineae bacterium]